MIKFIKKIKSRLLTFFANWRIQLSTRFRASREHGAAALITVLSVLSASLLLISFFGFSFSASKKVVSNKINSQKIFYASEAGLEDNIYRIKNQRNYTSTNSLPVGSGQSNITISSNGNTKTIFSEGVIGNTIRRLQSVVTITTSEIAFHYGVQVGAGGLVMGENAEITGNVYSNGPIEGDNRSIIDGEAIVATAMALDDQWTTKNNETIFGEQNTNPDVFDVAQSFTPDATGTLARIDFYLKKNGTPSDITVRILTNSGASPSKTVVGSTTLEASKVTTSYGWVDATFSTMPTLTTGITYWIMLDTSDSSNKYWYWGKDSDLGNENGVSKYSNDWNAGSPVWNTDSGDFNFKTWFGTGINGIDGVIIKGNAKANTITDSKICGDAYYQTIDSDSLDFVNSPSSPCPTPLTNGTAYPDSSDPAAQSMPISQGNITDWENDAADGGTISGDLSITTNTSLGPKKITGNLLMTSNNKTLTITGTVYVQGYIDVDNGSAIKCDASYGVNSCIIITDGWIHIANNGIFSGSGQSESFLMMLTASNCDGSFSSGCTHHDAAVDLHNNANAVIFYVPNGLLNLHNGVNVTEATAYKLSLDNGAIVTYDQGLANANFSSGPGASWQINDWKEVE